MPNTYRGPERRRGQADDHDTLIELVQILTNHVKNFEEHTKRFEAHMADDHTNFKFLNKNIYIGMGIIGCFQFLVTVIIAIKFH